jgi:hypothetical protein
MHIALERSWFAVGVLAFGLAIGAILATCGGGVQPFAHHFTLQSAVKNTVFGYDVSASGARVVVGDFLDCEASGSCNGSIRILRVAGKRLVEEAKLYGDSLYGYGVVAIHGNLVATTSERVVHVYERAGTWKLAARIPFTTCHDDDEPRYLALAADTLVVASYDDACVWQRMAGQWRMTSRLTDEWIASQPVIDGGVIAIGSASGLLLFKRGASGFEPTEGIELENPTGVAIANGRLAVESGEVVHVFDVSQATPREIAKLHAQSSDEEVGYSFGNELALDDETIAARADDGVHIYRRSGATWKPAGIIPVRFSRHHDRFGITLALGDGVLWIGDPNTQRDDDNPPPGTGYVHGYLRR